jgi:copper(I)-binding protein
VKKLAGVMLATVLSGALAGCGGREAPVAGEAWVRLAAVPGRPAAAYFTLHGGAKPATLAGLEIAGVPRVEMHESRMTGNGMMAMDAVASVPVPAGATVKFAPGGYHAMLFGVPASVRPGGTLTMRFRFADGSAVEAPAKVVGAGEAGPE